MPRLDETGLAYFWGKTKALTESVDLTETEYNTLSNSIDGDGSSDDIDLTEDQYNTLLAELEG